MSLVKITLIPRSELYFSFFHFFSSPLESNEATNSRSKFFFDFVKALSNHDTNNSLIFLLFKYHCETHHFLPLFFEMRILPWHNERRISIQWLNIISDYMAITDIYSDFVSQTLSKINSRCKNFVNFKGLQENVY